MKIGYYAHHHGSGHCRQADKLAGLLSSDLAKLYDSENSRAHTKSDLITVFTSMSEHAYLFKNISSNDIIRLPDEHERSEDVLPGRAGDHWQPECLHYSPVGSASIRARSQKMLSVMQERHLELMIVDLSVEVALLCRTASVPYLYVRLPGSREDAPHLNAFAGAIGLLAFYPEVLESVETPDWVRQKTLYLGFLPKSMPSISQDIFIAQLNALRQDKDSQNNVSQSSDCQSSDCQSKNSQSKSVSALSTSNLSTSLLTSLSNPIVTVIKGFGGHKSIDAILPLLRQQLPDALIVSLGPIEPEAVQYVDIATQVEEVTPFLQHSDVLVMACGVNAIGEACQFDTPLIVIPDNRPHDEQKQMADALIKCGRAISLDDLLTLDIENDDDIRRISSFTPISKTLMKKLQMTASQEFIDSIADTSDAKSWFVTWLLPKLACQPQRLSI